VKPSGCADIDTKIKTSNGIMTIEEIFEHMGYDIQNCNQGDWLEPTKDLLVYDENDELKPITKLFVNGFAETYEVSDENGNTYKFTAEHKVKVTGKGWVRVDELSEGDDVVKF
jgi:intein/homing endonuclease